MKEPDFPYEVKTVTVVVKEINLRAASSSVYGQKVIYETEVILFVRDVNQYTEIALDRFPQDLQTKFTTTPSTMIGARFTMDAGFANGRAVELYMGTLNQVIDISFEINKET